MKTMTAPMIVPAPRAAASAIDRCVEEGIDRAAEFLAIARAHGSPLYVFEPAALRQRARQFRAAFEAVVPDARVYYALKSNNLDELLRVVVDEGLGVDVSSGLELAQAVNAGATDIMFSGPGKTDAELDAAIDLADRVVVLLDSGNELRRLQQRAAARGVGVRAGMRLSIAEVGLWRKFGVPVEQLPELLKAAAGASHVSLEGLQFHVSWSLEPSRQVAFVRQLGACLAGLPVPLRETIRFIDVGGGFWPEAGEWLHDDPGSLPRPDLVAPRILPAVPIAESAAALAAALHEYVFPWVDCRINLEPGRWLCHDALHLLVTVIDKKADDLVIADAGTNAIGWERFESDYFPLINVSRPGPRAHLCTVYGSLCTPHDVWGFSYHGDGIEEGDVLLVPRQGAYTYSLRQRFIKPLPELVVHEAGRWAR